MGWLKKWVHGERSMAPPESGPLDQRLARFIPQELIEDGIRSRGHAFLLMRFILVAAVLTIVFAPYFILYLKLPYTGPMTLLYGMSLVLTPVILQRTRSVRIAANWTLSCSLAVLLVQCWTLGGVSSLSYPWLSCIPMSAMLLRGVRGGAVWTLVAVTGVVVVGVADAMGLLPAGPTLSAVARGATTITVASLTVGLSGLAWLAESRAEALLQDLQRQKLVFQERSVRDWLTGLANRSLLTECLIQGWERARRHGPRGAVFFIDLNDFKLINDQHGHAAGDQVLREVALRLQDTVRSSDLVGRIGGDEFALIIEGVESQNDVAVLAEKISHAIEEPIAGGGVTMHVGASIGVAFFPDRECHFGDRTTLPRIPAGASTVRGEVDHESVRRLLEKADAAMYTAKRKALRYWIHEHVADETLRGTIARVSEPPPAA
ncbi:MAG: GGDEF domain-containing protein [Deltaproteobacteria bacterium]|nr:GGDEF domain-containing protein [Deltaproteobacteria bacterium]